PALAPVCECTTQGNSSNAPDKTSIHLTLGINSSSPPALPFRVPSPALQSAAQFLRCPWQCCPPAPRPLRVLTATLSVRDPACRAPVLLPTLPRASRHRPFPGALSSAAPRALPATPPEISSAPRRGTLRCRYRGPPSRLRRRHRTAAVRLQALR